MMEKNSQSSREPDDTKQPPSPTLSYLMDKTHTQQGRKFSVDSDHQRSNFCLNYKNSNYTVLRVYINTTNSIYSKLYYTKFTPSNKIGQICIIHGYGQCTDDYLPTAQYFAKQGFVVNMIDLRGHGYSGGDRVNQHIQNVLHDISTLLTNCCERQLSTFIFAQGLGSIFLDALLEENTNLPIAGIIKISPLMRFIPYSTIGAPLRKLLLFLNPFLFGNLLVHNQINPTSLTKNPMAIKAKIQSVFFQSFITLKMAGEYDNLADKASKQLYKFNYPILICYGQKDIIQPYEQVRKYYDEIVSSDKHLQVFEDAYHEMHQDYQAGEVRQFILQWMKERLGKVKWKQPKSIQINSVCKKYAFWKYLFIVIGLLITFLTQMKKIKKLIAFLRLSH